MVRVLLNYSYSDDISIPVIVGEEGDEFIVSFRHYVDYVTSMYQKLNEWENQS